MSTVQLLSTLSASLSPGRHKRIETTSGSKVRRASVAAILRVVPTGPVLDDENPPASLEDFLSRDWVRQGRLEIGFIKRATKETDRWSGQVGFPGGKQEAGENDEETATRETIEEVGVDLRKGFLQLGRLDDRDIRLLSGKRIMVLCSFVYLQTTPVSPPVSLQTSEVDLFYFVPIDIFVDHLQDNRWVPLTREISQTKVFPFRSLLGLTKVSFPSVALPRSEEEGKEGLEMVLWGLTFQITSELLQDMGISGNMNRIPIKYEHPDMNFFASVFRRLSSTESITQVTLVFGASYLSRTLVFYGLYSISRIFVNSYFY